MGGIDPFNGQKITYDEWTTANRALTYFRVIDGVDLEGLEYATVIYKYYYGSNFYYDGSLVHSANELILDSLSNLNVSKFIIQDCNGKWRFVGDLNQYKRNNGEMIVP